MSILFCTSDVKILNKLVPQGPPDSMYGIAKLKNFLGGACPQTPLVWSCFAAALGVVSAPPLQICFLRLCEVAILLLSYLCQRSLLFSQSPLKMVELINCNYKMTTTIEVSDTIYCCLFTIHDIIHYYTSCNCCYSPLIQEPFIIVRSPITSRSCILASTYFATVVHFKGGGRGGDPPLPLKLAFPIFNMGVPPLGFAFAPLP